MIGTTNAFIANAKEIIQFTVYGSTYVAYDGMTWREFIDSEFNVDNFTVYISTSVKIGNDSMDGNLIISNVHIDDKIQATTYNVFATCCFIPGTKVLTSLTGETKNIEDIVVGEYVVSYNAEDDKQYIALVNGLVINKYSTNMAHVEFDNGIVLEMTDYHPIYTTDGFKSITDARYEKLTVGDSAKTSDGWSKVSNIILYKLSDPIYTYTLKVVDIGENPDDDTNDNFYANGIVVHNASACPT